MSIKLAVESNVGIEEYDVEQSIARLMGLFKEGKTAKLEFTWEEANRRFGQFDDVPVTFPHEFAMTLERLARNKKYESPNLQPDKLEEQARRIASVTTCPIQCLLFSNPDVRHN